MQIQHRSLAVHLPNNMLVRLYWRPRRPRHRRRAHRHRQARRRHAHVQPARHRGRRLCAELAVVALAAVFLSMAAMHSKPRQSLAPTTEKHDKRKSSRNSLFPINQFDTPRNRKSFELLEEEKSAERTPKEDLFSDEVDYDRIFKSRPRIATSPMTMAVRRAILTSRCAASSTTPCLMTLT